MGARVLLVVARPEVLEELAVKEAEEQPEEQEGECQQDETTEKDKTKVTQQEFYHFWKSLPEAPRAVQVAVNKVKGQPKRLADMAKAYAKQRWDHKLFASGEGPSKGRRCDARGHHGGQVSWTSCI